MGILNPNASTHGHHQSMSNLKTSREVHGILIEARAVETRHPTTIGSSPTWPEQAICPVHVINCSRPLPFCTPFYTCLVFSLPHYNYNKMPRYFLEVNEVKLK